MLRYIRQFAVITVLTALVFSGATVPTQAQEKEESPESVKKTVRQVRFPFRGTISAVDPKAMTITLGGKKRDRMIIITEETRIKKDGRPATLKDAAIGEVVGGLAMKTLEGKEQAISLRLGPKPGKATTPTYEAEEETSADSDKSE